MIDILKLFYTTHYNLGAVAILLLMLLIFFLSKKNLHMNLGKMLRMSQEEF